MKSFTKSFADSKPKTSNHTAPNGPVIQYVCIWYSIASSNIVSWEVKYIDGEKRQDGSVKVEEFSDCSTNIFVSLLSKIYLRTNEVFHFFLECLN